MLTRPTPIPSDPLKRHALEVEISSLLLKRAVHIVPDQGTRTGFMSTFFLVPKKGADIRRLILNLKPLNPFIRPKRFRMETLWAILESIDTPAWGLSLDLRDAYLQVPIRAKHRKFLRFLYNGTLYEFVGLPFGLSTSPRVFICMVRAIGAALWRRRLLIFQYLDDWLIMDRSWEATDEALMITWPHVQPGVPGKHREIAPYPLSGAHLSRCGSRPSKGACPPFGGTGTEPASVRGPFPSGYGGAGGGLAQITAP